MDYFSPLWERHELFLKPEQAIDELRVRSLEAFLRKKRSETSKLLSLDGMLHVRLAGLRWNSATKQTLQRLY